MSNVTTEQIIESLGGWRALRSATGAKRTAIGHWPRIGIPPKWWPKVIALAARKDVPWITLDVLAATRPDPSPAGEQTGVAA